MYGLETCALNRSLLDKIDAFQMRGLRKILGQVTTFINRELTNATILEMANEKIAAEGGKLKKVVKLSEVHRSRRVTMLAKIIAQGPENPIARATMDMETFQPHEYGKRSVG